MTRCSHRRALALATLGLVAVVLWALAPEGAGRRDATADSPPAYVVDPFWPKPLPNAWGLGQVAGVATDPPRPRLDRPASADADRTTRRRHASPAALDLLQPGPLVMEFDADGNFVQGWAGPGYRRPRWPAGEHGIFVDHKDNVWMAGNAEHDHVVLKFSVTASSCCRSAPSTAAATDGGNPTTRGFWGSRPTSRWTRRPTKPTSPTATGTGG